MSHSGHAVVVRVTSNVYVHTRAGLVCFRIMYQESLELVRKLDYSIGSIIERWSLKIVRDAAYVGHDGTS